MIQYDDLVLEHRLNILLRVQIKPIFQAQPAELMVHLLLLKEIDLLSLLTIAFCIQSNKLEQQVLSNLMHGLGHKYFALELGMHC